MIWMHSPAQSPCTYLVHVILTNTQINWSASWWDLGSKQQHSFGRELVFHAKKGRPHQRILFHCLCSTTIYHTSAITPSTLYPPAHFRAIMQHLILLSSVNYEPFLKFLLHYGSFFSCSLSCSKPHKDEIQKPRSLSQNRRNSICP